MNISFRTNILFVLLLLSCRMAAIAQDNNNVTRYVNPMIGTGAVKNSLSGNTFPGPTAPFGMVQLSPDTKENPEWGEPSGYNYNENRIYGFSHTHLNGTGVSEFFDIMLMPETRDLDDLTRTFDYSSAFSHSDEKARVGYYSVKLKDSGIFCELTATTYTGMHRYTYPHGKPVNLVLDMNHSRDKRTWGTRITNAQIHFIDPQTITGYRVISGWAPLRKVYFYARLSRPVKNVVLMSDNHVYHNNDLVNGNNIRAYMSFESDIHPLLVKVAISPVSEENARQNMEENPGWNFDDVSRQTEARWEKELSAVRVEGTEKQKEIFYTGLYHAYIQPNTFSDKNGEYQTINYKTRRLKAGETHYSTFSLWDTFRATHPLYTLLQPKRDVDFVNSLIRQYDDYGYLPIWQLWGQENYCMIGNHSIPVIVDAILKKLPGIDVEKAYEAIRNSSLRSHLNSPFNVWEKYGYMPENIQTQSVSLTLEMAYNDYCVARLAKLLHKDEDYARFSRRSRFYRNLFDSKTKFFRAKNDKGEWIEPFDPLMYGANGGQPFTEGNAWQYLWFVPQNVPDLINLMGGNAAFRKKLDTFFTLDTSRENKNYNASGFIGQYAHGNEPSHHVAYLYDYVGAPSKTQYYVNKVMRELYTTDHDGYSGNEDCGQMSSWFIFSSMGFYPVDPVSGVYVIGSPLMNRVDINLPNGKMFTIKAPHKSENDIYIQSVKFNGKPYNHTYIRHEDILNGGVLEFTMGDKPSKWGARLVDRPQSNK